MLEQGLMALKPARQVIDPGSGVETQAPEARETLVKPGLARTEKARLFCEERHVVMVLNT